MGEEKCQGMNERKVLPDFTIYVNNVNCFIFTGSRKLYIVDINNGEIKNVINFNTSVKRILAYNGFIFIYGTKGQISEIYILDTNANIILQNKINEDIITASTNKDKIYIVTAGGRVYLLSENLKTIWNKEIKAQLIDYCFIYNDYIIVFSNKGEMFLLDSATGKILRKIDFKIEPVHIELLRELNKLIIFSNGNLQIYDLNDIVQ
mgnify:CR=1 FL=1